MPLEATSGGAMIMKQVGPAAWPKVVWMVGPQTSWVNYYNNIA